MNSFEPVSKFRAESAKHEILAAVYEYFERCRNANRPAYLSDSNTWSTTWNGHSWLVMDSPTPLEAYLLIQQPVAPLIDGVDAHSEWGWLEEAALAEALGVSTDFINGVRLGINGRGCSSASLLFQYQSDIEESLRSYTGNGEIPTACESEDDFYLGVEVGRDIFYTIKVENFQ